MTNTLEIKSYNETIAEMENKGWFRVSETRTHIFFYKRMADGSFARCTMEYK